MAAGRVMRKGMQEDGKKLHSGTARNHPMMTITKYAPTVAAGNICTTKTVTAILSAVSVDRLSIGQSQRTKWGVALSAVLHLLSDSAPTVVQ